MATRVRSYSKINLGLAIGPPRPDGFHGLVTLYQTLALHDVVTLTARPADGTSIRMTTNHPHVPTDARNTAWKMVELTLRRLGLAAEVAMHIQKNLPIQGGMGAGSANAAAALLGLEKELDLRLPEETRLELAAGVGSDVPLFLVGGAVLGRDRGQLVQPVPDLTLRGETSIPCVIALPGHGVSTPAAFREWDARLVQAQAKKSSDGDLHDLPLRDTIEELSRTYSSVFPREVPNGKSGASGIFPDPSSARGLPQEEGRPQNSPGNLHGHSSEQHHTRPEAEDRSGIEDDLAENSLLALVRTGIENDFETVVFPQYPHLREIKRHLMGNAATGSSAEYAALSGSGSALFGLYRTEADADAAQQRLRQCGVQVIVTKTMPRPLYWSEMFAE